ncbi:hypothetical protein NKJ28_31590 [Mesorhizobium sp. M0145]|uniref:hypothetical protein n=1 Tax=unclassified Mesorhizobium TaxID=325217 RepID=UPI003335AC5A
METLAGSNHNRRGRFDMAVTQNIELPEFSKLILAAARPPYDADWFDKILVLTGFSTGGTYRARNGICVGPLRPFRDESDGAHTDAAGRSAWFMAEGIGAYDRYGCILSGVTGASPLDCVSTWDCGFLLEAA